MKRIVYIIAFVVALAACNSSGEKTVPKPVEEFIANLYDNYVFGSGELDSIADNFAPAVLDSLRKAYDAEYCDGGPAYAVWLFRTGQNGSDEQTIDSIKADDGDRYTVYLTDGGTPCTCQMHIVMDGGKPVLMDFTTAYDDGSADVCRKQLSLDDLEGEWRVIAVDLEGVTYTTVTMTFDTKEKTVDVYAGCNHIGGQIAQNERSADALRFEYISTTEMFCGYEVDRLEKQLAKALEKVRSFYGVGDDIYMADEDDNAVLHISRKE